VVKIESSEKNAKGEEQKTMIITLNDQVKNLTKENNQLTSEID